MCVCKIKNSAWRDLVYSSLCNEFKDKKLYYKQNVRL